MPGEASEIARCDTPAATAFCFRSARKRSNVMPPWHAAPPRNIGAAAGFGAALAGRGAAGRVGGGKGCCASAEDERTKQAATAEIAIRRSGKSIGIKVTGWREKFPD